MVVTAVAMIVVGVATGGYAGLLLGWVRGYRAGRREERTLWSTTLDRRIMGECSQGNPVGNDDVKYRREH